MDYIKSFDTWESFIDYAEPWPGQLKTPSSRVSKESEPFEQAINHARHGWPEGTRSIKERLDNLTQAIPPKGLVKVSKHSYRGPGTLSMGRYLMDHPKPWRVRVDSESEYAPPNEQIVTLIYNLGAGASVQDYERFDQGAIVCCLVDQLEKAGKRVAIEAVSMVNNYPVVMTVKVTLKQPNAPLDIDRISFAMANIACLRRLIWSVREHAPAEIRHRCKWDLYGTPMTYRGDDPDAIVVEAMSSGTVIRDWKGYIKRQLARFNISWGEA